MKAIGVRWTIGDVSARGFEALRLSAWGAFGVFGGAAEYVVCVNSLPSTEARSRAGKLPPVVRWHDATGDVPELLARRLDAGMAEGVAWKLAPLRMFPDRWELALDNDCILWSLPDAVARWLDDPRPDACLVAEDVRACFGMFADLCGAGPKNSGLRGTGPAFDLEAALAAMLAQRDAVLRSELDEQGLQIAALVQSGAPLYVVSTDDVTICSPFPPHQAHLGRAGAHFVGLNAHRFGWQKDGRPAEEHVRAHWDARRAQLEERVHAPTGDELPEQHVA